MSIPHHESAAVLRYDATQYREHERYINDITEESLRLGLLRHKFRDEIFKPEGIVCSREYGDTRASVSRSFFGLAVDVNRKCGQENNFNHIYRLRNLLFNVLAVRLSIMEDPKGGLCRKDLPVETYADTIKDLEQYRLTQDLPSLLPNYFLPSSLFRALQKPPWNDGNHRGVREMYSRLLSAFCCSDRHLHAVVTAMQRNAMSDEAINCILKAASHRSVPSTRLFEQNPLLRETWVLLHFDLGKHDEVIAVCSALPVDAFRRFPQMLEKYIRSLTEKADYKTLLSLFEETQNIGWNRHVTKAKSIAAEVVGWYLFGEGKHEEALRFLNTIVPEACGEKGEENLKILYEQHLRMVDPEQAKKRHRPFSN